MSPTQRTLSKLKKEGFLAEVTERWNPWSKTRHDLFSFIDVLAVRGNEIIGVQTTSGANVAARIAKIRQLPDAALWLSSPSRRIIIHGWAKRGPRGKVKRWACRQVEVTKSGEVELGQDPLAVYSLAQYAEANK